MKDNIENTIKIKIPITFIIIMMYNVQKNIVIRKSHCHFLIEFSSYNI